jgi:hypothetical protein
MRFDVDRLICTIQALAVYARLGAVGRRDSSKASTSCAQLAMASSVGRTIGQPQRARVAGGG